MKQVWKTSKEKALHPIILAYVSVNDIQLDQELLPYDIQVNKAHVKMLASVGLISHAEKKKILTALDKIPKNFKLDPALEDVHMNVESHLTKKLGAAGKKIHTARSRNDQVMTDLYLYMNDQAKAIQKQIQTLQKVLTKKGNAHPKLKMPAYTHMQPAVPIKFKDWLGVYVELLNEDLKNVGYLLEKVSTSPLGACAVAGTTLPINKSLSAKALGFKKPFKNPLATISSRGEAETQFLYALSLLMLHLNKFAKDLQLYSTFEVGMISLDPSVCTSSSIMPQKKNPDPLEVLHAKTAEVHSLLMQNLMLLTPLTSGYQREMQQTKSTLMAGIEISTESLDVMKIIVSSMTPKHARMKQIIEQSGCLATSKVEALVKQGTPFRDAYKTVRAQTI